MANDATVTVRIPSVLKRRLEARAREGHRSLSAQVLHDLAVLAEVQPSATPRGRFLGLFAGASLPTDAEILEVRAKLWGRFRR